MFDFDSPTPSESSDQEASDKAGLAIKTNSGANRFLFPGGLQHKPGHPQALPSRISHNNRLHTLDTPTNPLAPPKRKEPGQTFPELRAELNQAFSIRDIQVPMTKQTMSSSLQGNPISTAVGNTSSSMSFSTNPALYSRHKGIGKGLEDRPVLPPLKYTDKTPVLSQVESSKYNKIPPNPLLPNPQRNWNVATGFSYTDTAKRRLLSPAGENGTLAKRPNQYDPSPVNERHKFRKQNSKENLPSYSKPPLNTIQHKQAIPTGGMPSLVDKKYRRRNFKLSKDNSVSQDYTDTFWFDS